MEFGEPTEARVHLGEARVCRAAGESRCIEVLEQQQVAAVVDLRAVERGDPRRRAACEALVERDLDVIAAQFAFVGAARAPASRVVGGGGRVDVFQDERAVAAADPEDLAVAAPEGLHDIQDLGGPTEELRHRGVDHERNDREGTAAPYEITGIPLALSCSFSRGRSSCSSWSMSTFAPSSRSFSTSYTSTCWAVGAKSAPKRLTSLPRAA